MFYLLIVTVALLFFLYLPGIISWKHAPLQGGIGFSFGYQSLLTWREYHKSILLWFIDIGWGTNNSTVTLNPAAAVDPTALPYLRITISGPCIAILGFELGIFKLTTKPFNVQGTELTK